MIYTGARLTESSLMVAQNFREVQAYVDRAFKIVVGEGRGGVSKLEEVCNEIATSLSDATSISFRLRPFDADTGDDIDEATSSFGLAIEADSEHTTYTMN